MKIHTNLLFLLINIAIIGLLFGCPKPSTETPSAGSQNSTNSLPTEGKAPAVKEENIPKVIENVPAAASGEFKEQEPNDHYQSPNKVSQLVIVGNLSSIDDKDQFELTGQQGTNPTFTLEHGADVNFNFKVYSNNENIAESKLMKSPDVVTANVPGTCLINIVSIKGSGDYKLTITPGTSSAPTKAQVDENQGKSSEKEPNDFNNPTPFSGETIYGQIESPADEDWYLVNLPADSEKTFAIYHDPANDFDFEIHTDTGILATVMSAETGDSRKVKVPRTFKIKVWKGKGTGWYRIEIK